MTTTVVPAPAPIALPPELRSVEDTGLPFSVLCDLVLKVLYFNGAMIGRDLANHVRLPFRFVEQTLRFLADEGYASSHGMRANVELDAGEPIGAGMQYGISGTGRTRARELLDLNQYAGPAPVPISDYSTMAEQQSRVEGTVERDRLRQTFAELVVPDTLLDHLGPALSAREAVFLYGPPGNGKTTIAELLVQLIGPPVFIPRALYVHGEIIRLFDPIHHIPLGRDLPNHDRRWELVYRPCVKVGGELTPRMLDLGFDQSLGFYEASMQLKANGGLFLIDDFGRQQQMSPRDLLNRLIVPLEKKVDYLNIARAGTSVSVPFTCLLMLSTNLRPQNLMDEAFLRRVRYKVYVPDPTEEDYHEIWRRQCKRQGVEYRGEVVQKLIETHYLARAYPLHGSHPRDLLNHMIHASKYFGKPVEMTHEMMTLACETYFVESED